MGVVKRWNVGKGWLRLLCEMIAFVASLVCLISVLCPVFVIDVCFVVTDLTRV
jgi:hypothetical protein